LKVDFQSWFDFLIGAASGDAEGVTGSLLEFS
jgi:hypothetical protein